MTDPQPRHEYRRGSLDLADLDPDPLAAFRDWLEAAVAAPEPEPAAMTLATADADGRPSARTVLLRGLDERGFAFFTNMGSRKARELHANPRAALVFHWQQLERQVIVNGSVDLVASEEADAYFATRSRESQLAAWVSPQSEVIDGREHLERRVAETAARYPADVPRPPHWSGFRIVPSEVEFWQGRPARLHDRIRYRLTAPGGEWVRERLGP